MLNSKQATELALQDFPRWMDIKKRSNSIGRKLLESIYQEQDNIKLAYEEFIKSFFLKTYNGKEDTIPCHVLLGNIGKIERKDKLEILLNFPVTENPKVFLDDPKHMILLQDVYVILDPSMTTKRTLDYVYNNNKYSLTLKEHDLWNIFDEFALFSSLERFPNESNSELVKRIYAQYKTPPSSPARGIKNAIINSVKNYDSLDEDEIIIEEPNGANMYELLDNGNTVYEELSSIFLERRFGITLSGKTTLRSHVIFLTSGISLSTDIKLALDNAMTSRLNSLLIQKEIKLISKSSAISFHQFLSTSLFVSEALNRPFLLPLLAIITNLTVKI